MAEVRSSGGLPKSPIYLPTAINQPTYDLPTPTSSNNAEDETPFYSTSTLFPLYNKKSPIYIPFVIHTDGSIYIPTDINQPPYDVPTTTANNAQGSPPPSITTTPKAFEMQAQAYNSQQHNHQLGEGEEQPMTKLSSSGAFSPMPPGSGCIEEQPRIPVHSFDVVLDSDFTNEEREIYNKIVCESDGFDCPYVRPGILVPCLLKPYPLEDNSNVEQMEFDYMADLALKHYNDLNGSSYQLVEVIKSTIYYSAGCVYNITLRAKDDMSGSPPQNFQARVYDSNHKHKVIFCRVEGNAEPTAIGDLDKRPGCWVPKPLIFLPVGYSYSSSGHLMYGSSSDVPTTTANDTECPPPPSTTTTALTPVPRMVSPAFEMQHSQAYESQQHNHQHGEGEEQPKKKPSSSGVPQLAVPPIPRGLGCIEEKQSAGERIPVCFFTDEERKIYNKIVSGSDGFDCPYVHPGIMVPDLLKPYPLENISDFKRMEFDCMADLALRHYNDLNGSSYQLVEVIKATVRYSAGCIYNITLRAKDDKSGSPPQNFQARVYDSVGKYKVLFCRVEGDAERTSSGDLDKCPPPCTDATASTPAPGMVSPAFELQHEKYVGLAQAYKSQQHIHQHGEGEEQPKKKPRSS